ncbi:aminopeptidase [Candidatus Woesearchaeota archaeon]|nr:aminopeptidase [Candidatus Woesearchaeota archaeon]
MHFAPAFHSLRKTLLVGITASLLSSGCAEMKYYGDLAVQHLKILAQKESIEDIIQDPTFDEETKRKLHLVQGVREYAFKRLHLPETEAYTTYVDLQKLREREQEQQEQKQSQELTGAQKEGSPKKKDLKEETKKSKEETKEQELLPQENYVVVFITACRSDKFEVKEWWYPFVGFQQMRTFYDEKEADAYAQELQQEGWDVALSKTRAYSTGKFLNNSLLDEPLGDPVTNVMLNQSDAAIIEYLFHEIAHQVVYVEGDTTFNESFAEFVGEKGTELYLRDHHHHHQEFPNGLAGKQKRRKDDNLFYEIVASYTQWLSLLYDSSLPREEKLRTKQTIFQAMKTAYLTEAEPFGAGRRKWFEKDLNNAHLVHLQHYNNYVDEFATLFEISAQGHWSKFYEIVRTIAEWPEAKRKEYMESIPTK